MRPIYPCSRWSVISRYKHSGHHPHSCGSATERGFSLTELLIVIVVIGILILMAYPEFSKVIVRAKETEAKIQLQHVYALEKSYSYEFDRYTQNLAEIGYEQPRLITHGGQARYMIDVISAGESGFVARATAVVDFDKDGVYSVWTIDEEGTITHMTAD